MVVGTVDFCDEARWMADERRAESNEGPALTPDFVMVLSRRIGKERSIGGTFSGTEGNASNNALSKKGEGREPADETDTQDDGLVESELGRRNVESLEVSETSVLGTWTWNAEDVICGKGGTGSVGIEGRLTDRFREVDRLGGCTTLLSSTSDKGARFKEIEGSSKAAEGAREGNFGEVSANVTFRLIFYGETND